MVDFVGKAKWEAWNSLGDISQDEAKKQYTAFINELAGADAPAVSAQAASASGQYETILVTKENGVATILLNRPKKKNALLVKTYHEIRAALADAANDKSINVAVMTGAGDYYCSGNDLSNFTSESTGDLKADTERGGLVLRDFVASYIDFPKTLIGAVNGPAIGISVTLLGLFDLVFASDKATFQTPFATLGQSPEGCSSLIFPMLMGSAKANELLMMGRVINAHEGRERGLVTEVIPDHTFRKEVEERVKTLAKLPKMSLSYAKQVYRNRIKQQLHEVNELECNNLVKCWQSEDCLNAVMAFLSRKSKL